MHFPQKNTLHIDACRDRTGRAPATARSSCAPHPLACYLASCSHHLLHRLDSYKLVVWFDSRVQNAVPRFSATTLATTPFDSRFRPFIVFVSSLLPLSRLATTVPWISPHHAAYLTPLRMGVWLGSIIVVRHSLDFIFSDFSFSFITTVCFDSSCLPLF